MGGRRASVAAVGLAFLLAVGIAGEEERGAAPLVAAAWLEGEAGHETLVVALQRTAETEEPRAVWVGVGLGPGEEPGSYGRVAPESWTRLDLSPGVLVRATRNPGASGTPTAVVVADRRPEGPLDVHELIDGRRPPGLLAFLRPDKGAALLVDRHLVEVGGAVNVTLAAPDASFFSDETLELAEVARRLGVGSDDPDGPAGHADVAFLPGDDPAARALEGEAGEKRLREFFTDPRCAWANRSVGWLPERWMLEYVRRGPLRFRLDTTAVRQAGVVSWVWKGHGAFTIEAIHRNGFGGSSSNLVLPPVVVVPAGTTVVESRLR